MHVMSIDRACIIRRKVISMCLSPLKNRSLLLLAAAFTAAAASECRRDKRREGCAVGDLRQLILRNVGRHDTMSLRGGGGEEGSRKTRRRKRGRISGGALTCRRLIVRNVWRHDTLFLRGGADDAKGGFGEKDAPSPLLPSLPSIFDVRRSEFDSYFQNGRLVDDGTVLLLFDGPPQNTAPDPLPNPTHIPRTKDTGDAVPRPGTAASRLLGRISLPRGLFESLFPDLDVQREDDGEILPFTDLDAPNRTYHVVTTAALPWMTGTSVNPLLRSAQIVRRARLRTESYRNETGTEAGPDRSNVTLVVPWLMDPEDRAILYRGHNFSSPADQEAHIRRWMIETADLAEEADPETGVRMLFYPARYHPGLGSIFAMGDILALMPKGDNATAAGGEECDVAILEEPEHLNWYRAPGDSWTKKFKHVVGIVHTNYKAYAKSHYSGIITEPMIGILSSLMVRAYCHKVIKLSAALQSFAPEKEAVANVHGVREGFLAEGRRRAAKGGGNVTAELAEAPKVYFIGKKMDPPQSQYRY